jgi:hypothetical protein
MNWLRSVFLLLVFASVLLRYNRFFTHQGFWTVRHGAPVSGPTSARGLHDRYLPSVLSHPKELPSGVLPRHDLTPGGVDPRITQQNIGNTICRPGYSASVRPPFKYTNAMKHRLMRAYGVAGSIHDYELDHLIPIGVGGCPDCESNLWPEPRNIFPGAEEKDEVEDYLHRQVCSGALSLAEAQQEIASNWYEVYQRLHAHGTNVRSRGEQ